VDNVIDPATKRLMRLAEQQTDRRQLASTDLVDQSRFRPARSRAGDRLSVSSGIMSWKVLRLSGTSVAFCDRYHRWLSEFGRVQLHADHRRY